MDTPAFVQQATRARADVLLANKRKRTELAALSDALHTTAMGTSRDEIVGQLQLPSDSGDISSRNFALVPSVVPQLMQIHGVDAAALTAHAAQESIKAASDRLVSNHIGILHDTLPVKPVPPAERRICFEAQECVCSGDGKTRLHMAAAMQRSFNKWKNDAAGWKLAAKSGELVLRFHWEDRCPGRSDGASVS